MRSACVLVALLTPWLGACTRLLDIGDVVLVDPDAGGGEVDSPGADAADGGAPITGCSKVDLLFMIDDSGSMAEEQNSLVISLPSFMQVLQGYRTESGAPLDYRIGVVTPGRDLTYQLAPAPPLPPIQVTEEGEDGALRAGCELERRWIEASDPDPTALFSCRASVGTMGAGTEMPFYALKLATFERVVDGTNAGFLRPDAPLVMMVISDEDDCSREDNNFTTDDACRASDLQPPTRYRDYFDQLKGSRDLWAMAIVAGPGPGECTSKFGTAADGIRFRAFRDSTGSNVAFESICAGNLALSLLRLLDVVEQSCAD